MKRLLKTLRFIQHTVGAKHALVEIGDPVVEGDRGEADRANRLVHELAPGMRLRLRFEGPVPPGAKEKLHLLVESLDDVARGARRAASVFPLPRAQRELSDRLNDLAVSAGALRAVVLDGTSPVLFGDSHDDQARLDVEDALHTVRLARRISTVPEEVAALLAEEPKTHGPDSATGRGNFDLNEREWRQLELMAAPPGEIPRKSQLQLHYAVAALRESSRDEDRLCEFEGPVPFLARRFASIYWVLLVFDDRFSEVVADGHLVKALDAIERLVISLPPLDPDDPAKSRRFKPV